VGLTSKLSTFLNEKKKKKTIVAETLSRASLDEVPAEEDELQVNMVERISTLKQSMPNSSKTQPMNFTRSTP